MQTLIFTAQFLVGLVAIVKGADWMTDGAAAIAKRYGISTLVIGMTIIAIGSSAPEFVVSVLSAIQGNTDMAIGNVVGSNIFNILTIMGATAFVIPVAASRGNIRNDVPFAVLSSLVVFFAAFDGIFTPGAESEISRSEGLLMLCLFAVFMSYTFAIAKAPAQALSISPGLTPRPPRKGGSCHPVRGVLVDTETSGESQALKDTSNTPPLGEIEGALASMSLGKSILYVLVGLGLLIFGGEWLVDGASGIASQLGVSQSIIALTIVSMGTSAPELAASLMAAKKGDTAMALGNVVGSVIFNVFFVLGTAAAIHPLALGNISIIDIVTLLIASGLLWVFCKTHSSLVKWEGAVLLIIQVAYYVILVLNE